MSTRTIADIEADITTVKNLNPNWLTDAGRTAYINEKTALSAPAPAPVEAHYIAGKPSPDSKSRVRVDIELTNSVNGKTVVVKNVLVDDGYTETLCIHSTIANELGLKKSKTSHDLNIGDGSIIKEHKYFIGRKKTDFVACQIKLEPKKTCIPSNSGAGMKESISGLESNVPLESSSESSLGHSDRKRKHEESTSEQEEDVEDDNEDERESVNEETAECFLRDVYCDNSENIIGAKALMLLGVLVEFGTGLRKTCARRSRSHNFTSVEDLRELEEVVRTDALQRQSTDGPANKEP
eukprot:gene34081-45690_t